MGLDPITLGLTLGGVSAAGSLLSGLSNSSQQKMQAQAAESQASQLRQQAKLQEQAGQIELKNIDKQRAQMRRQYANIQSANAVNLGIGNVDLSSGSGMQVAEGNANLYASDIGENAYSRALKDWETKSQMQATQHQADLLESQASWQRKTSNNLLPTLIGAGLAGTSGFMSGYSYGGQFGARKK